MKTFDAHFHIIDYSFPVKENHGYLPPEYMVEDYRMETTDLNIAGGAVVSGSFQGFDQGYLIKALQQLGSEYCGVTQLPYSVTDEEVLRLHENGVRALRFNIRRGGSEDLSKLDYLARRVYELAGWHSELYIDAKDLPGIAPIIEKLPAVSVDHLGLSEEGLPHLVKLAEKGVRVKATGFGRVDLDVPHALKVIYKANPDALMFGTDLPSTRAKRRFEFADAAMIRELFDENAAGKIMYTNGREWYSGRFKEGGVSSESI